jgi:hyperosmotically inducible protein
MDFVDAMEVRVMRIAKSVLSTATMLLVLTTVIPVIAGCAGTPTKASTGEHIDDAVITAKVKAKLFNDNDVSGFDVQVETFKGQVQLSGFVDTPKQKQKAEQVARTVPGVKSVANNLLVKNPSGA